MNSRCKECGYEDEADKFRVPDDPEYLECPECGSDDIEEE